MSDVRRVHAIFSGGRPHCVNAGVGVTLEFRTERARLGTDRIDDFADLGPALTVPAVFGLGKVLRLLRAGRIAFPREPLSLVGREEVASGMLERVVGTPVRLDLRLRVRVHFVAWTDHSVEVVSDVLDVREGEDAFYIQRRSGRAPVRLPRADVVRHQTRSERWFEVLDIQRA